MLSKTLHAFALFAVLFGTWFALSGLQTPLFLFYGAASTVLVTAFALRMDVVDKEGHPFHLALSAPFYWLWLLVEIIKSGLTVTRAVWSPTHDISPAFARIDSTQNCDLGRTIYANSITLTPGTVCVAVEKGQMLVHALEDSSITDLKSGVMDRRVARLTASAPPQGTNA